MLSRQDKSSHAQPRPERRLSMLGTSTGRTEGFPAAHVNALHAHRRANVPPSAAGTKQTSNAPSTPPVPTSGTAPCVALPVALGMPPLYVKILSFLFPTSGRRTNS